MAKKSVTKKATTTAVEVVGTGEDLAFLQEAGAGVVAFLKKAAVFLQRGEVLEHKAAEILAFAKTIKPPTNGEEDVALQQFIQRCTVGTKTVSAHWDGSDVEPGISRILYRLHRRVTQKRDKGLDHLKSAADIGNKLHNGWTRAETERAETERRRLQLIEDGKAQQRRDDELAELDRIALLREAESDDLSEREQAFVIAVAVNYTPKVAAQRAGYKNPDEQGARLIKSKKIVNAITARKEANALREQAKAIAETPVDAVQVEVEADVQQAAGAHDRTQWKLDSYDAAVLIAAAIKGDVPYDLLAIDEARLKQYVRDLKNNANRWPSVKAIPDTRVV